MKRRNCWRTQSVGVEDSRSDLVLELAGRQLWLEVKYYSLVDRSRAFQVLHDLDRGSHSWAADGVRVVVSDRIVEDARKQFREAGVSWFDLRGHLYLNAPGLLIDVATGSRPQHASSPKAFAGRVGLATAVDILLTRPDRVVVRETARRIGAAPSTVSSAMRSLRNEGLMDERGEVDVVALFWATAREWKRPGSRWLNTRTPTGRCGTQP